MYFRNFVQIVLLACMVYMSVAEPPLSNFDSSKEGLDIDPALLRRVAEIFINNPSPPGTQPLTPKTASDAGNLLNVELGGRSFRVENIQAAPLVAEFPLGQGPAENRRSFSSNQYPAPPLPYNNQYY